jgi:hypothetical protein
MLAFIVAFRAKCRSKNWEADCLMLQQTLRSICNQTDDQFRVFVIYTDLPAIEYDQEKVLFEPFPFPLYSKAELIKNEEMFNPVFDRGNTRNLELVYDKSKRILYGCGIAKNHGCDFIMSVDADDLISNRVAEYVNKQRGERYGWFVDKGYIMDKGSKFLIKVKKDMANMNGSTNIVRADLVPLANFDSLLSAEFSFFDAHAYLRYRILHEYQDTLKPLPFYAVIYLLHNFGLSGYKAILTRQWLRTSLKLLVRGKWLNNSIRNEFGFDGK